jgi:hypothetical protein
MFCVFCILSRVQKTQKNTTTNRQKSTITTQNQKSILFFEIRAMKKWILFLLLLGDVTFSFAGDYCMLYPISLQQRVDASSLIVEGKVVSQYAFWNEQHTMIYTSNTIEVLQVFKGNIAKQIDIVTEGGTLGNKRIEHSSTLQLSNNQYGIFFCQPSPMLPDAFLVYSSLQGFIHYQLNEHIAAEPFHVYHSILDAKNEVVAITKLQTITIQNDEQLDATIHFKAEQKTTGNISIKSFSPTTISGGTNSLLIIKGNGFGDIRNNGLVLFTNANDGGQTNVEPTDAHYLSWNDTMIVLRVPSTVVSNGGCAGTGNLHVVNANKDTATSKSPLTINFTYSNFEYNSFPYNSDLVNQNSYGGYTFQLNISFQQNIAAVNVFKQALNNWCASNMNWDIAANATTINTIEQDGTNVIRFDIGNEMPTGLLGKTITYYTGKGQTGEAYDWYVSEIDMMFDDAAEWNYDDKKINSNQYDFQSVATHELGHVIQLNHVINTTDLMYYSIDKGVIKQLPSFDDIVGARYIIHQSLTTNANGPLPMHPRACSLPFGIVLFAATVNDSNKVLLQWKVDGEHLMKCYELTRSTDNFHFTIIDTIQANNFSEPTDYSANDVLIADTVYYRLILVNTDSSVHYSSTILVNKTDKNNSLLLYPNPSTTDINISTKAALIETATITLYASDGRTLINQNLEAYAGLQEIHIPVYYLDAGIYFYEINLNGVVYRGKIAKE